MVFNQIIYLIKENVSIELFYGVSSSKIVSALTIVTLMPKNLDYNSLRSGLKRDEAFNY